MSVNWTAFEFKRALMTAVAGRAGITSLTPTVRVISYFPSLDESLTDSVIVGFDLRDESEKVTLGGQTHEETVDVTCQVRAFRAGAGQSAADEAEDRAETLLAEVDAELRSGTITVAGAQIINPGVLTKESLLFSWQAGTTAGKHCIIEFVIRYRAKTAP